MSAIRESIARHPVFAYFALAFAISWGGIVLAVGPGSIPATGEQIEPVLPWVYLAMLAGPSVAGLALTGLVDGRAGFRELGSRLLRFGVGVRWYAVALLAAPLAATVGLLAVSLAVGDALPEIATSDDWAAPLAMGLAAGLLVGGFEEIGWTGFVVPRLLRRRGILSTGLLVGALWGAWHFLSFWEADSFAGALPLAVLLVRLISFLPPYRILMVWVYDRTASLGIVMLMHASLVASTVFILVPPAVSGLAVIAYDAALAGVLWTLVAAVSLAHAAQPSSRPLSREMARRA